MKKILSCLACLTLVVGFTSAILLPQTALAATDCETSIIKVNCAGADGQGIWDVINFILEMLTYAVGVLAVGAIAVAGVMYATASGNDERVKKAKTMILNTVIGLLAYALLFTITNFLVPGGVF
jgi:hypothetical protein